MKTLVDRAPRGDVEERLRHHEVSAGLHLLLEPRDLERDVGRVLIERHADEELKRRRGRAAARDLPAAQPVDRAHEPDRVDLVHALRFGHEIAARRIARDHQHVADAAPVVRADHLREHTRDGRVARRDVRERLHAHPLDPRRDLQRILPRPLAARVDVDEIDEMVLEDRVHDLAVRLVRRTTLRIDLQAPHELAQLSFCARPDAFSVSAGAVSSGCGSTLGGSVATWTRAAITASGVPAAGRLASGRASAAAIAAICTGVVPQQPPMMRAPSMRASSANAPYVSGDMSG